MFLTAYKVTKIDIVLTLLTHFWQTLKNSIKHAKLLLVPGEEAKILPNSLKESSPCPHHCLHPPSPEILQHINDVNNQ